MEYKIDTDYKFKVDACAEFHLNVDISNGHASHAVYLMTKLFDNAQNTVLLSSGMLVNSIRAIQQDEPETKIYADPALLTSATGFLKKPNSKLEIVVDNECDFSSNAFINHLTQMKASGGIIGTTNIYRVNDHKSKKHFFIADETAYRDEKSDCDIQLQNGPIAIANFGNERHAKVLAKSFSQFKQGLSPALSI